MPRAPAASAEQEEARWENLQQDVAAAADDREAVRILSAFVDHGEHRLSTWTPGTACEPLTRHMREALDQLSARQAAAFAQQQDSDSDSDSDGVFARSVEEEACVLPSLCPAQPPGHLLGCQID